MLRLRFGRIVRRTLLIGAVRIKTVQNVRDDFARQAVGTGFDIGIAPVAHGVHFVVARPKRQTRMLPQLFDGPFDLRRETGQKLFRLRRERACDHEIMPDHDAVFVAVVVEGLRAVGAAAPDAQHVAAQICEQFQDRNFTLVVQAVQGVRRNPVGAFHHDRRAVHDETRHEILRVFVVFEHHGPQADAFLLLEQQLLAGIDANRCVIKVLFTVTQRPPKLWIADAESDMAAGEIEVRCLLEDGIAAFHFDFHLEFVPFRQRRREIVREQDVRPAGPRVAQHVEIAADHAVLRPFHKLDVPRDAAQTAARADVPSVFVDRLAQRKSFRVAPQRLVAMVEFVFGRRENRRLHDALLIRV